ncbi:MAG: hypothetical protein HPY52_09900 [Firmicutes bacterium]|nr:hypothetical protein [Bacillota bacterium]
MTGGHIPWVTVGLPDYNYSILSQGGAASRVSRADYGSWSGVRVDLDRDYRSGETFRFNFQVKQDGMGRRRGDAVEFAFVPGWYDRAETDRLEVRLKNPGSPEALLHTSPEPTERTTGGEVVWIARLGRGERFKVAFAFSPELFPGVKARAGGTGPSDAGGDMRPGGAPMVSSVMPAVIFIGIIVFLIVFVSLIALASLVRRGGYKGRRGIYYGTYFPIPPVGRSPWGSGSSQPRGGMGSPGGSRNSNDSRKSGGGGGFGGRAIGCACVSCACACVSCACACACAGGGGAGCARKFDGARPTHPVHPVRPVRPAAPMERTASTGARVNTDVKVRARTETGSGEGRE